MDSYIFLVINGTREMDNVGNLFNWFIFIYNMQMILGLRPANEIRSIPYGILRAWRIWNIPPSLNDTRQFHRHDDVIKWKYFPRYWPFVRGIHRSPVNSSHKGQ